MTLSNTGPRFEIRHESKLAASGEIRRYHGSWTLREGYVKPAFRGRGLQRRLIRARLRYAKDRGALSVVVWVEGRNSYSLNNLVEEGFRFTRRCQRAFGGIKYLNLEHRFRA